MQSLTSKISLEDMAAYKAWQIPAQALASKYGTTRNYIYQKISRTRRPKELPKSVFTAARRAYRDKLALTTSVQAAAEIAHCSPSTMRRHKLRAQADAAKP